jgi:hypothetical protein
MKHKFSLANPQLFCIPSAMEGSQRAEDDLCNNADPASNESNITSVSIEGSPDKETNNKEVSPEATAIGQEATVVQGELGEVKQFTNPDESEKAADEQKETNEQMLMRAAYHIKQARAQRRLYRLCTANAIKSVQEQTSHSEWIYTLVVDYGQNMDMPVFNSNEPGEMYYYSPLSVYNLGVVNAAHVIDNDHLNP